MPQPAPARVTEASLLLPLAQAGYEERVARVLARGDWMLLSLLGDRERGCAVPPGLRCSLKAFVAARPGRFELRCWDDDAVGHAWQVRLARGAAPAVEEAVPPARPTALARAAPAPQLQLPMQPPQLAAPAGMHPFTTAAYMPPPLPDAYAVAPNPWTVAGLMPQGAMPPQGVMPPGFGSAAAAPQYATPAHMYGMQPPPVAMPACQSYSLFSAPPFAMSSLPAPAAVLHAAPTLAAETGADPSQGRLYQPYVPRGGRQVPDDVGALQAAPYSREGLPAATLQAPQSPHSWSAANGFARMSITAPPAEASCNSPRRSPPAGAGSLSQSSPARPAAASPRTGKPLPQPRAFAMPQPSGAPGAARNVPAPRPVPPPQLHGLGGVRRDTADELYYTGDADIDLNAEALIAALVDTD
jgi:hypothetical protein